MKWSGPETTFIRVTFANKEVIPILVNDRIGRLEVS
jgi:hypothetical protein